MGAIGLNPTPWTRRMALALAAVPLGLELSRAGAGETAILVVSRKRLLNDTDHARALLKAEIELTAGLQRRIDAVKAELNAEEQELARLRPTLERAVFDERVAAFDRKIRSQRREAQQQAANLQNAFQVERQKLVEALGPVLEGVREAYGASIILNADQALASDPALDVTGEVIARFNTDVSPPAIPDLDSLGLDPAAVAPGGEPPPQ
jgi:Skp family chaperone for outer membrane proteins